MKIEILHNGTVIETKDFAEGSHKIGRAPDCEIVLKSPLVSKHHALIVVKEGKVAVVDTGSSNGIFVNGILVRKQRIGAEDVVDIGDYRLRMARVLRTKIPLERPAASANGNAALNRDASFQSQPMSGGAQPKFEEVSAQERLVGLMDNKLLSIFYSLLKSTDYRFVLGSILISTMVGSVLASVTPILNWGKETTKKESIARGHTVITQMVRENYRILNKANDASRLTVDASEKADGFLSAYVMDAKTKSVLAPAKYLNKSINDPYVLLAINDVMEGKESLVSKDKGDGVFVLAQAVPFYGQQDSTIPQEESSGGPPTPTTIILAYFQIPTSINSTFEPLAVAGMISFCLSLLAFFLIFKMISHPVTQIQEQMDAALKGDDIQITCEAKFPELEALATVINFSVSRMRQAGGGLAGNPSGVPGGMDAENESDNYIKSVAEFCFGSSDGVLVLDPEKKVKYVSPILEDLLSLRTQYAMGQNIGDACRDGSFAGTVIDMAERVVQSLGESQTATLDINGVSRNIAAIGHRFSNGDIGFVVITVKMNG